MLSVACRTPPIVIMRGKRSFIRLLVVGWDVNEAAGESRFKHADPSDSFAIVVGLSIRLAIILTSDSMR